jgi:hypothetical protein
MGIFANFTDTADTGTDTVTSGDVARAADLKLAHGVISGPGVDCIAQTGSPDIFTDDLTVGASASDVQPSSEPFLDPWYCLKNAGSSVVAVDVAQIYVVDTDVACTGDEAKVEVAGSCGGDAVGELSGNLRWLIATVDCATRSTIGMTGLLTSAQLGAGLALPGAEALAPGDVICITVNVSYPTATPLDDVLAAQSDQATWAYRFSAATP